MAKSSGQHLEQPVTSSQEPRMVQESLSLKSRQGRKPERGKTKRVGWGALWLDALSTRGETPKIGKRAGRDSEREDVGMAALENEL